MLIEELRIRNFRSFGNNEQVVKFNTEGGELILLSGKNGFGKCVDPNTEIEVEFTGDTYNKFLEFISKEKVEI